MHSRLSYEDGRGIVEFEPRRFGFPFACAHPVFGNFLDRKDLAKTTLEQLTSELWDSKCLPDNVTQSLNLQFGLSKPRLISSLLRSMQNEFAQFSLLFMGQYSTEKPLHDDIFDYLEQHPLLFPAVHHFKKHVPVTTQSRPEEADLIGYSTSDEIIIMIEVKHSESQQDPASQLKQ